MKKSAIVTSAVLLGAVGSQGQGLTSYSLIMTGSNNGILVRSRLTAADIKSLLPEHRIASLPESIEGRPEIKSIPRVSPEIVALMERVKSEAGESVEVKAVEVDFISLSPQWYTAE